MIEPHVFTHDGVRIEYFPPTVRSTLARSHLITKLVAGSGYLSITLMPDEEWSNMNEYAAGITRCKADAPWWVSYTASVEQVKAAYECFLDQDSSLYAAFVAASSATMPPKKTEPSTLEMSPP